jgi:hypothetical protein
MWVLPLLLLLLMLPTLPLLVLQQPLQASSRSATHHGPLPPHRPARSLPRAPQAAAGGSVSEEELERMREAVGVRTFTWVPQGRGPERVPGRMHGV